MNRKERKAVMQRDQELIEQHGYGCDCIECHPCGAGTVDEGTWRALCLGWTCGVCFKSGRCTSTLAAHSCGAVAWTNALFALLMFVMAAVVVLAYRGWI